MTKASRKTYLTNFIRFRSLAFGLLTMLLIFGSIAHSQDQDEPIATAGKPNILFISVDDLAPELSFYGNRLTKTPTLDKLAADAFVFERAYCQVPVCGASRASLLTGLLPTRERFLSFNTRADEDAPDVATLPQWFKEHGYVTISNGKVFHNRADSAAESWSPKPWQPSLSHAHENDPKSKQFRGGSRNRGPFYEASEAEDDAYYDGIVARKTVRDLEKLKDVKKPFFLACGFIRPHLPFYAPSRYWDLYDPNEIPLAPFRDRPGGAPEALRGSGEIRFYDLRNHEYNSDSFHRKARHGYLACVSYVDAQIGRVLDALEANGHSDNTIVVLWGDHGFHLGDHNFWGKLTLLHQSLQVPLLIKVPEATQQKRISSVVSLVDLYPTLCDLAGLEPPDHLQGRSLIPIIDDSETSTTAYARISAGDTVIENDSLFTRYRSAAGIEHMLFELDSDPHETTNLAPDLPKSEFTRFSELLDARIEEARRSHSKGDSSQSVRKSRNP